MRATYPLLLVIPVLIFSFSCGNSDQKKNGDDTIKNKTSEDTVTWYGIDISDAQADMLQSLTPPDSLKFIICKASDGQSTVEPGFYQNVQSVKQYKRLLGVYHFYQTQDLPQNQATFFWNTIKNTGYDIAPVLDIENGSFNEGADTTTLPLATLKANLLSFLEILADSCQCTPIVYTNRDFADPYLSDPAFAKYPLWMADMSPVEPAPLPPWKKAFLWQKTDNYTIQNWSSPLDLDVYTGLPSQLAGKNRNTGQ